LNVERSPPPTRGSTVLPHLRPPNPGCLIAPGAVLRIPHSESDVARCYDARVPVHESLGLLLAAPSAETVWRLRGELLAAGRTPDERVFALLAAFHDYLDRLATGMSSRDFSHLASKLDISAISGVILERLAEQDSPADLALNLVSGALSEGLMVLATRQHVRAWEGELAAVHRSAAFALYQELWRWSADRSPKLDPAERRRLLDDLVAPAVDPNRPPLVRATLICRLFQLLIASEVSAEAR